MHRHGLRALLVIIIFLLIFAYATTTRAASEVKPDLAASPYDLVNAVNTLRASYSLDPYSISSILMSTAQNQADYMAATGSVSHIGAGGSSVTDRLLAAGYPLAGELSLGGFRSENITSGSENMSAQAAVDQWSRDSVHLTTMVSADLTEIGAGISVSGGRAYFVIDCARPKNSDEPLAIGTTVPGGSTVPSGGDVIAPVMVSTPNADGDIIHEVKAGQTLWQIAISYNTKIDEIKRLNNLLDNNIYPGTKLLIKKDVILIPTLPVETATVEVKILLTISPTTTDTLLPLVSTPGNNPTPASTNSIIGMVIGILAIAILGGCIFIKLGNTEK